MWKTKSWVTWQSRDKGNEGLKAFLKEEGRVVFQGKAEKKKSGETEEADQETSEGRAVCSKGWWRRGDVGAHKNKKKWA